jgi:hypothetical protein
MDFTSGENGDWLLIHDLTGNKGFIKPETLVSFIIPGLVILTQDKVQVFSLPSNQSEVIMEFGMYDCFYNAPISVGNILTDAQWAMVEDLSGNHGFIKGDTQVSPDIDIKAKGFSQLLSRINNGLAFQEEKPMDRINEYKEDLVKHIKSNKDCFSVINYCGYAGADWLLQPDMVDDATVQSISERACGKAPALKFDDRGKATVALIAIEKARKNGRLVPSIIQAYRTHNMAELKALERLLGIVA